MQSVISRTIDTLLKGNNVAFHDLLPIAYISINEHMVWKRDIKEEGESG